MRNQLTNQLFRSNLHHLLRTSPYTHITGGSLQGCNFGNPDSILMQQKLLLLARGHALNAVTVIVNF